jgi:hypothetical protein
MRIKSEPETYIIKNIVNSSNLFQDDKPDYFSARKWRDDHESSDANCERSFHLHNPTFAKTLIGNSGSITGENYFNLSDSASKRSHEGDQEVYTCIF